MGLETSIDLFISTILFYHLESLLDTFHGFITTKNAGRLIRHMVRRRS